MKGDDLAIFKKTYITECFELLGDMDELLLSLQQGVTDSETLNAIFRCAHSIKGGAGAFGLTRIAEFTHVLEALLDDVRLGKVEVDASIVDVLLEASDILKQMVSAAEENRAVDPSFGDKILADLVNFSTNKNLSLGGKKISTSETVVEENNTFTIKFTPHSNLFASGNEPILIVNELKQLGQLSIKSDISNIPMFDKMNPEACFISFVFELTTKSPLAKLKEVFEFVEDDCDLEIISNNIPSATPATSDVATQTVGATKAPHADGEVALEIEVVEASAAPAKGSLSQHSATVRVDVEKIDKLVNLVGELVITQAMISAQTKNFEHNPSLLKGVEELAHHTRELQEAVMSVRMQPVKSVFSRMPRIVRDLAKKLDKDVKIDLFGENTEVDKTIIEQLSDPLTHMIRNSVDHGLESREARIAAGKDPQGFIKLCADQRGGKIVIEIIDDGAGINRERVLKKAMASGLVSSEEAKVMLPEQIDYLVFAPGFSTAEQVTDVSGRGVGMDVVKRNIEGIGGSIEVKNNPGQGLHLFIYIPLTLAILDGMIVGVGDENYIVPISNIVETLRPTTSEIKKIAEGNDLINVRGEFIQIVSLFSIFDIANAKDDPSSALILIIEANNTKYGLMVDELIGQQQVVIKSLSANSASIEGVSGATILGDGRVSLILDVTKLQGLTIHDNKKMAA